MHDDDIDYIYHNPDYHCWNCGARGRLAGSGFMHCRVCEVMWSRWARRAIAPMYETI